MRPSVTDLSPLPTNRAPRPQRRLVAFLSHAARTDVGGLRRLLNDAGMDVRDSFPLPGATRIAEGVLSELQRADLVVAVLHADATNVFFEVGFASALEKPVLLIAAPGVVIPPEAGQHRIVSANIDDSDILKLTIRGFLREVESKRTSRRARGRSEEGQEQQPNRQAVRKAMETIRRLRGEGTESALAPVTSALLRAAGVTAIEEFHGPAELGVDFAVWSDALSATFGNPILIELKAGNFSESRWMQTLEQVAGALGSSGARLGLFLYLDRKGRRFKSSRAWAPLVLSFDLEDFAESLLHRPFAAVLLDQRNRVVHGLP